MALAGGIRRIDPEFLVTRKYPVVQPIGASRLFPLWYYDSNAGSFRDLPQMKLPEMRFLNLQRPALGVSFQKRNVICSNAKTAARQGGRIGLRE